MVTIAMTREMGTLGKDVAQGVADVLGLKVVHSELVEHDIAEKMGVRDSAVHRYLEGDASLFERWRIDKRKLSQYTAEEMLELAVKGNVIIRGWGAVAVLRTVPSVMRVRVCAPMAFREKAMMERMGIQDAAKARKEIEQNDAAHARVTRGFFGVNWENPLFYHAVLNTGALTVESCVKLLASLAAESTFQENDASRMALTEQLIRARVTATLGQLITDRSTDRGLQVGVSEGRVTLSGYLMQGDDLAGAIARIRKIEGVISVDNHVRLVGPRQAV